MRILVTGGTGYIGSALIKTISEKASIRATTHKKEPCLFLKNIEYINVAATPKTCWESALYKTNVVIHTIARVHILNDKSKLPLKEFIKINVEVTMNLAKQAASSGVRRFIFISSIGVNGRYNTVPFTENDTPNPQQDYAQSKYEAEIQLEKLGKQTNMEIVIVRPPLVYGLSAPGNFGSLVSAINKSMPLPLNNINNKLSLIALNNLIDFIITCIDHPKAANETFLICDDQLTSTTLLIKKIGHALHKKPNFFPFSKKLIITILTLMGKKDTAISLFYSLRIDNSKAKKLLGWSPKVTMEKQFKSPL